MARLLDVHSDADHHRSVFTLAGAQGSSRKRFSLALGRLSSGSMSVRIAIPRTLASIRTLARLT